MVIEKNRYYKVYVCVYILAGFIYTLILCGFDFSIGILALTLLPMYLFIVSAIIATGRTFIMDEYGCTVCYGKYRKKYVWEQFKTRKIEVHTMPSMLSGTSSCPYLKEAIFSPYIIHKPKIIRAEQYSIFHPFSCIYVHFDPKVNGYSFGRYYEVDEAVFLAKMEQWGVGLGQGTVLCLDKHRTG